MRKLLSSAVHFTPHSDQYVTCADCLSRFGLVRTIFFSFPFFFLPVQRKTETKLIFENALQTERDRPQMAVLSLQVDWTSSFLHLRGFLINVVSETNQRVRQLLYGCDKA